MRGPNRTAPASSRLPADPHPWLSTLWGGMAGEYAVGIIESQVYADTLDALQGIVGGLSDDDTPYRVSYIPDDAASAGTDLVGKAVVVGSGPLRDSSLTVGQRRAILTGLMFHEVGHIRHTQPMDRAMKAAFPEGKYPDAVMSIAHGVSNVAEDIRLESRMAQQFPGFAETLVSAMTHMSGIVPAGPIDTSGVEGRFRAFLLGSRYPWRGEWAGHESLRDTWQTWADACEAPTADDPSTHVSLVIEAIERILDRPLSDLEDEPTPPPPGKGKGGSGNGPGGDAPTKGGSKGGDPDGDDPDGTTEGGGDKSGDPTEGGDPGKGDGNGGSDRKGTPKGSGGKVSGDDADAESTSDEVEDGYSHTEAGQPEGGTSSHAGNAVNRGEGVDAPGTDLRSVDMKALDEVKRQACPSRVGKVDMHDLAANSKAVTHRSRKTAMRTRAYTGSTGSGTRSVVELRLKHRILTSGEAKAKWSFVAHDDDEVVNPMPDDYIHADEVSGTAVQRGPSFGYRRTSGTIFPQRRPDAERALAAAMNSARRGPGFPERGNRSGRIDRSALARVASGNTRVFIKPNASAPQKVRVSVLIDASGSMSTTVDDAGEYSETGASYIERAAQAARDLAGAIDSLPWATGSVACHTTAYSNGRNVPVFIPLWKSGEPTANIADVLTVDLDGNEDGYAVAFACDDLLEALRRDEKGLLIVISDGAPAYANGEGHTRSVVDHYRKRGLRIVSVSISAALRAETQHEMYGTDVVEYNPSPTAFARSLARVIGSSI